jgi:hypothetical protein
MMSHPDKCPDRLSGYGVLESGPLGIPTLIPTNCRDSAAINKGKLSHRQIPRCSGEVRSAP